RDEAAAVARPGDELRKITDRRLVSEDGAGRHELGAKMPERAWYIAITPGILPEVVRIDLQFDEMPDGFEAIAEQEARALEGAEEIADHRKAAALDAREEQCGTLGLVDAALDLGRLEMRIDFVGDAEELPRAFEIAHTFLQAGVTHMNLRRASVSL